MAMKLSTQAATTMLNALAASLNSGFIRVYSGAEPTTANTGLDVPNNLLAELTFGNPAFGTPAPSGGDMVITANPIAQDTGANADGTALFFRATTSGGVVVYQGTVGTTGQQLNLTSTNIVADGVVSVTALSIALPLA